FVREHIAPLFSRVIHAQRERIYLANHSLGRPLDATEDDVREGLAAWYARLGDAWDDWGAEMTAFRTQLAALAGAPRPDCIVPELPKIVAAAHAAGARVLLDVYHSLGVFAVDLEALDVDFAVGGSYKYLRGGPGACFLFVAPRHLDAGIGTLDIGWFAKESPF